MSVILLTNATQYAGPGALTTLLAAGHHVLCADPAFEDPGTAATFAEAHAGAQPIAGDDLEGIRRRVLADTVTPDAIIFNDVHPNSPMAVENIPVSDIEASFAALVLRPILLTQMFLGAMKTRGSGSLVYVTSARERRPEPGFSLATSMRAATTTFARAVAREAAPFGVQVNVVAPNYLYSEAYYPRARYIDDGNGRAEIASIVPFGRLGAPDELGELITFLCSGKSPLTTGQVIDFSGGWS